MESGSPGISKARMEAVEESDFSILGPLGGGLEALFLTFIVNY